MDYKKLYKDALEKAREIHNYSSDIAEIKRMEQIFPELAESENEKIRKDVLAFIRREGQHIDKYKWHKWITWLEKQGEQKPAWSVEDEKYLNDLINYFVEYVELKHRVSEVVNWLKSLKYRVQPQNMWKPSKEQIVALQWILNNIPYNKHKEEISGLLDQIKRVISYE